MAKHSTSAAGPREPALTREMITRAFPEPVADDRSAMPLRPDADIAASLEAALAALAPGEPLWIFAYGSLMWDPSDLPVAESVPAVLKGWHRRFCLWQWRYRGTREAPGLMLALDRGGSCRGIALRVAGPDPRAGVAGIWRREMIAYGYVPRWVTLLTETGALRAIAFVANREGPRYAGRIPEETAADHIARACGHIGPAAAYLLETVLRCEAAGIADRHLWRMQALVAERMRRPPSAGDAP